MGDPTNACCLYCGGRLFAWQELDEHLAVVRQVGCLDCGREPTTAYTIKLPRSFDPGAAYLRALR